MESSQWRPQPGPGPLPNVWMCFFKTCMKSLRIERCSTPSTAGCPQERGKGKGGQGKLLSHWGCRPSASGLAGSPSLSQGIVFSSAQKSRLLSCPANSCPVHHQVPPIWPPNELLSLSSSPPAFPCHPPTCPPKPLTSPLPWTTSQHPTDPQASTLLHSQTFSLL